MPSAGTKSTKKSKRIPEPQIIRRYKQICRRLHKNSATLFPRFIMSWHSMTDFAKALAELERQAVQRSRRPGG